MSSKRINIPAILMVMAILAIIAFQSYWMYKNYQEEEKTVRIRTAAIFRNVAYRLQAENLKVDTTLQSWSSTKPASPMPTVILAEPGHKKEGKILMRAFSSVNDSLPPFRTTTPLDSLPPENVRSFALRHSFHRNEEGKQTRDTSITIAFRRGANRAYGSASIEKLKGNVTSITIENKTPGRIVADFPARPRTAKVNFRSNGKDSTQEYMILSQLMEDGNFRNYLQRVDSLADSVNMEDLAKRFRDALDKESMKLDFTLAKDTMSIYLPEEQVELTQSNEVMMGYSKTYFLRYHLLNTFRYIVKKLSPQIGLSLLLIALTSFTFMLLYRNMMRQRKLTQFKNDLISNITHELKTPIATVSVAIEALKKFHAMDDPRRTEEYLDISNSELQRLSLLVDKVLRLSMFEKHQVDLKMERFDLQQLVEEVMGSMRLQFEKVKAHVQLQAGEGDLSISADRLHITSVIFNLLDNALKYSGEKPDITVSIQRNEEGLELKVTDNGIGIPAVYRKKVFDKFFRVPSGDTHNVKGHGLGLSYVAHVVDRHNGNIRVDSEPGKGSSFIIQLPDTV